MTGCGCESWRGAVGHQRATASGPSERCFVHHVGQVIFALTTCHLRGQCEGSLPPCSPVATLCSLKHLYSPALLRLLSRTLAGGVSVAWGEIGGGGEGRVAVRAFQWETQWEQLDPCPEEEWPLGGAQPIFPRPHVTPAIKGDMTDQHPSTTMTHTKKSSITVSRFHSGSPSPTPPSPSPSPSCTKRVKKERMSVVGSPGNVFMDGKGSDSYVFLHDSSPVQLEQIVMMAAERVTELWSGGGGSGSGSGNSSSSSSGSGSLAEAVVSSPHRLIQHVMTAQKQHLKTK